MIGPSVLHGPHHSAHRSTTTGTVVDRSITAVWNVASVTSTIRPCYGAGGPRPAARAGTSPGVALAWPRPATARPATTAGDDTQGGRRRCRQRPRRPTASTPTAVTDVVRARTCPAAAAAAGVRAHRRGPLQPDLLGDRHRRTGAGCCAAPRWARCSPPPTTWAGSTRSSRPWAGTDVPVPRHDRAVHRRRGQRRPVLRHGLRRRARWSAATPTPSALAAGQRAGAGRVARRRAGRHPRRRRGRRRPRRPRPQGGLHRPPAQALVRPVPGLRGAGAGRARPAGGAPGPRRCCRPTSPTQQGAAIVHGDYRLDNCMLGDGRRRSPRCSTGRSARSATPWPTSGCCGSTGPTPTRTRSCPQASPTALEGFPRKRELMERYADGVGPGPVGPPVLRGLRLLEADLHHRRRVRPLRRRGHGRRPRGDRSRGSATCWTHLADLTEHAAEVIDVSDALVDVHDNPELDDPVMVVALDGWIDAGVARRERHVRAGSSSTGADADRHVRRRPAARPPRPAADHAPGQRADHRPDWPAIELRAGTDAAGNDLLLLIGAEPDFEWQAFAEPRSWSSRRTSSARMVVDLGAYPAPVPHTRRREPGGDHLVGGAVRARSTATCAGTLDVPGGIHAVIDVAANARRHPHAGAVGPGAPLRVVHALPRGQRGPARGARTTWPG